ncbi:hypothetical protein DERF_005560 [Dermatophagoides farinae]|uniref:Uncharacterized protein n=1 Tax=Dermatophagoides farinae TaxID=6954 RepID=A0A922LBD9_DERFA|nr:hypothetical protein DERF_005560 [Dermatophagoides farinae]
MEKVTPNNRYSLSGTTMVHKMEDNSNDTNQKKHLSKQIQLTRNNCHIEEKITYAEIMIIIRIGSLAITRQNIANEGPKAIKQ